MRIASALLLRLVLLLVLLVHSWGESKHKKCCTGTIRHHLYQGQSPSCFLLEVSTAIVLFSRWLISLMVSQSSRNVRHVLCAAIHRLLTYCFLALYTPRLGLASDNSKKSHSPVIQGTLQEVAKPFRWNNRSLFALVDQVNLKGKCFSKIRASANASNNYHGMSSECLKGDRMKEKWASLKKYPNSLRKKSTYYHQLFLSIEHSLSTASVSYPPVSVAKPVNSGQAKASSSSFGSIVSSAPMLPEEPVVRRVARNYHHPATRKNAYGRGHALKSIPKTEEKKKRSSSVGSTKKKNYPPSSVIFAAKYKSRPGNGCTVCRKPLLVGQLIHNCGTAKKAIWTHSKCEIVS